MHIELEEKSQEVKKEPQTKAKPTRRQGIWRFVRFVVVTGIIFSITFFTVNFSAYSHILNSLLNPEKQQQAQAILNESTKSKVDSEKLLPTLPDKPEVQKEYAWLNFPISPTDNRLVIPKLAKNIPLVDVGNEHIEGKDWTALEKQIQEDLKKGVALYPKTARPGQYGNVFITGHSSYYAWDNGLFKDVFALLHQLEIGDTYYVYYEGKQYAYQIYDKYEVTPDNVDVLSQPSDKKISTLMTCTPVGTTLRRLVINAKDITNEGKNRPKLPAIG